MINIDNMRERYADRFGWCGDSMIPTYFEGHIGTAAAEKENDPAWVMIRSGDFYFAAGEPVNLADAAKEFLKPGSVVIADDTAAWLDAIRAAGIKADAFTRYHTVMPKKGLDRAHLEECLGNAEGFSVKRAGEYEYARLRDCEWESAFVMNFDNMDDFLTNGFGYCIFAEGELVSAATTYGWYSGGYELQIATAPNYRRRGLAAAAGAAFILECLDRGKIPHWDAANQTSVRLAQRLGFEYGGEYQAIDIHKDQSGT